MPTGKPYFATISTNNPNGPSASILHQEQLNNYLTYGSAKTNSEIAEDNRNRAKSQSEPWAAITYQKHVKHVATSSVAKGDGMIQLITVLCCEDEQLGA